MVWRRKGPNRAARSLRSGHVGRRTEPPSICIAYPRVSCLFCRYSSRLISPRAYGPSRTSSPCERRAGRRGAWARCILALTSQTMLAITIPMINSKTIMCMFTAPYQLNHPQPFLPQSGPYRTRPLRARSSLSSDLTCSPEFPVSGVNLLYRAGVIARVPNQANNPYALKELDPEWPIREAEAADARSI